MCYFIRYYTVLIHSHRFGILRLEAQTCKKQLVILCMALYFKIKYLRRQKKLWWTSFHFLYIIPLPRNIFFNHRWCLLDMTELALFLGHFLSFLTYASKIFFAIFNCLLMRSICLHYDIEVHNLTVLFAYISIINCAFHTNIFQLYHIYSNLHSSQTYGYWKHHVKIKVSLTFMHIAILILL